MYPLKEVLNVNECVNMNELSFLKYVWIAVCKLYTVVSMYCKRSYVKGVLFK